MGVLTPESLLETVGCHFGITGSTWLSYPTNTDIVVVRPGAGGRITARVWQVSQGLKVYRDLGDHRDEAIKYMGWKSIRSLPVRDHVALCSPCSLGAPWTASEVGRQATSSGTAPAPVVWRTCMEIRMLICYIYAGSLGPPHAHSLDGDSVSGSSRGSRLVDPVGLPVKSCLQSFSQLFRKTP